MSQTLEFSLAVGNNNAAGLVLINTIKPSGDTYYIDFPTLIDGHKPGIRKIRMNARMTTIGKPSVRAKWNIFTWLMDEYFSTTYCGGGYDGLVTARLRVGKKAWANYNCTMVLPAEEMRLAPGGEAWADYEVTFFGLVAL